MTQVNAWAPLDREMFYPALFEWKIMVLSRSNDVIRMAFDRLARS